MKKDWIKNKEVLGTTPERRDALAILEAGLDAIETGAVIRAEINFDVATKTLRVRELVIRFSDYKRIYLIAFGKCATAAAGALEEILGDELTSGIVLDIQTGVFKKLLSRVGTHPLPSAQNVSATNEITSLLTDLTVDDLVLVVVSGGGSALLCQPYQTDCETIIAVTKKLMESGATISELNTVRKHLSQVAGGQLAKIAYPATVLGLIFSDVIGDDPSVIASGPLTRDETTVADANTVLEKYQILNTCQLPNCELTETPKEEKYFEKVETIIVVNNRRALNAMKIKGEDLGYTAVIKTNILEGEAQTVGAEFACEVLPTKTIYLYGGETTVKTSSPSGEGGRNQELALASLNQINEDTLLMAFASDGRDNSQAAGAIADTESRRAARAKGLNASLYLQNHNSYSFWGQCGNQILTGPTEANVADLILVLRG